MKISIIVNSRFWAYDLAKQLEKNKIDYKLISSYYTKESLNKDKVKLFPWLTYLPYIFDRIGLGRIYNIDALRIKIFEYLATKEALKGEYDITHCFSGYAYNLLKASQLDRYKSLIIVDTGSTHPKFQEGILKEEYSKFGWEYHERNPKTIKKQCKEYEMAKHIIVPSQFVYDTLVKNGVDKDKIKIIPFGVDVPKAVKREEGNKFTIMFAGSNTVRKGVHHLIQAFSELNLKNAELKIAGHVAPETKKFARKYPGNYSFLGNLAKKDLQKLYKESSIFVLPSIEEGSARVIYEAMAYGLPCIATTNTGPVLRHGKDGFIIPIRDVNAIKKKILYLYENEKERKRMSISSRKHIKNYTWERYGKSVIKFYKEIL